MATAGREYFGVVLGQLGGCEVVGVDAGLVVYRVFACLEDHLTINLL